MRRVVVKSTRARRGRVGRIRGRGAASSSFRQECTVSLLLAQSATCERVLKTRTNYLFVRFRRYVRSTGLLVVRRQFRARACRTQRANLQLQHCVTHARLRFTADPLSVLLRSPFVIASCCSGLSLCLLIIWITSRLHTYRFSLSTVQSLGFSNFCSSRLS